MHRRLTPLVIASALLAQSDWTQPFPAHRVIDNVYYVGSAGLASYLDYVAARAHQFLDPDGYRAIIRSIKESDEPVPVPNGGSGENSPGGRRTEEDSRYGQYAEKGSGTLQANRKKQEGTSHAGRNFMAPARRIRCISGT